MMSLDIHILETVIRRASTINAELELFTDAEYPTEAIQLRDLLATIVGYIAEVLQHIKRSHDDSAERSLQVQQLARSIHELYAMLRFLRDSASMSTPPALQAVVSFLNSRYSGPEKQLTIVRPQWEYNCKFINLSYELSKITVGRLPVLTTGGRNLLGAPDLVVRDAVEQMTDSVAASQIVLSLLLDWKHRHDGKASVHLKAAFPKYISVLSLAGIEKHDVFLYPMMAHEVAHSIAYSQPTPAHLPVTARVAYGEQELENELRSSKRKYASSELPTLDRIVTRRIEICIRELLADLIAIRMLGVGYFFGLASFLGGLYQWSDPLVAPDSSYPSMRLRLKLCFEELVQLPDVKEIVAESRKRSRKKRDPSVVHFGQLLKEWVKKVGGALDEVPIAKDSSLDVDDIYLHAVSTNAILRHTSLIVDAARQIVPNPITSVTPTLARRIQHLVARLPPLLPSDQDEALPEIFTAAWVHRSLKPPSGTADYDRRNRLLTKAIELAASPTRETKEPAKTKTARVLDHNVFTGDLIATRANLEITDRRHLAIIPYRSSAPAAASLDVHLGNWFKLSRRPKLPSIDISRAKDFLKTGVLHDEFFVKADASFILHAGDFALGITQEFFGMPDDAMAFVEGKSSIGRTGLIVATATQVAPGFHGCIVLELANTGTVPLEIRPGMEIAQLVVIGTSEPVSVELLYGGDYDCQIRP